jgi:hypothetical protein
MAQKRHTGWERKKKRMIEMKVLRQMEKLAAKNADKKA